MLRIKVLGMGCPKCKALTAEVQRAIAATGVEAEISKVEDIDGILAYGVAMTPALVVGEKVLSAGRIPREAEIAGWLREASASEAPVR